MEPDINKLKDIEMAFRTLTDVASDATTITDVNGTITFASKQTARLHGYDDPQELADKVQADLQSGLDANQ